MVSVVGIAVPCFTFTSSPIGVFPQDTMIFFVHAYGIFDANYISFRIIHVRVKIMNFTKAIATEI